MILMFQTSEYVPLSLLITPCPPRSTLFPYTTLFRSLDAGDGVVEAGVRGDHRRVRRPRGRLGAERERGDRSEEHTSELQSRRDLVCRLLLEKKKSLPDITIEEMIPLIVTNTATAVDL